MLGDGVVIQQVLLAAMDTTCLHLLKLPRPFRMVQLTPPALREGLPAGRPALCNYATIEVSKSGRRVLVSEHISRKELKHDRVRESIEHGAEAVLSHTRIARAARRNRAFVRILRLEDLRRSPDGASPGGFR